jgi:hypothetical protein
MSMYFRDLAAQTAADGTISPEEILILRRAGWSDGTIDADEAEAIFAVNDRIREPTPEWNDFFVEALSEFIVNGAEPAGCIDEAQADWLIARIDHDGALASMAELELVVKLFERASAVPDRLRAYGIAQIEKAVLGGDGPTRIDALGDGAITDTEVRLLRRLLFAPASERPAGVSRSEAEMLFRLKDAALGAANHPEWKRLFVQGAGNYLMAYASYEPLSHERAAELEEFVNWPRDRVGRFFARMARLDLQSGFTGVFGRNPPRNHDCPANEGEQASAPIDEYEQALMDFLASEGGR